MKNTVLIS